MSAEFPDHFSEVAGSYADFRPHYSAALFEYLATLVPSSSRVWDCAAGSGQATIGLATRFAHVIATDASADQIAVAAPRPNVEYRVAVAEQNGLADASVELVTVAQALHWFKLERFYAEVQRVLVPGGVFAAWAYGINQVEGEEVNRLVQEFYVDTVGPFWPAERRLVESGYRTIPFPFVELSPPSFQMEVRWNLDQLLGYFSTWSATNRFIRSKGSNPVDALKAELAPLWGVAHAPRRVTWPLSVRVGRLKAG